MLNRIKGSKPQRKLTLVKLLTIVAVTNLIVWCLFTDTVYAVFTTAADLEGDNFKTLSSCRCFSVVSLLP